MTASYKQLQSQINGLRFHWRLRRGVEGVFFLLTVSALLLCLAAWIDWINPLGHGVRWSIWLLAIVTLGWLLWRVVIVPTTAYYSDAYFAVLAESRQPGMENKLINAVQLGKDQQTIAPTLLEALIADAMTAMSRVQAGLVTHRPALSRNGMAAVGASVLLCLFLWLAGPGGRTALERVLLPWATITPFTWTTLNLTPAQSVHMLQGEPLDVTITWQGRQPSSPAIHWVTGDGMHRSLPLSQSATSSATPDQTMTYRFESVQLPMHVFATGGDGQSEKLEVSLEPRPRVQSMVARITPPAYTSLKTSTKTLDSSQMAVYPGSVIDFTITTNTPLAAANMIIGDERMIVMKSTGQVGIEWTGSLPITAASQFTLKLQDKLGHVVTEPGIWQVSLLEDSRPLVNIVKPGRDESIIKDASLSLVIQASDDLGLGQITLLSRPQGKEQDEPKVVEQWSHKQLTELVKSNHSKQITLSTSKTAADFGLTPGQSIQYWVVAEDRNPTPGPGMTNSQRYVLTFLTPQQAHTQTQQQILNYSQYIGQLLKNQKTNLTATTGHQPAGPLALRQIDIRHQTLQLIEDMERSRFEGRSIMVDLGTLASREMAQVIASLESARDAKNFEAAQAVLDTTLSNQNQIITTLESILQRLDRNESARKKLKQLAEKSPGQHQQVTAALEKIARDLDRFLVEQKQLEQDYEKMPKRGSDEENSQNNLSGKDPEHRLDRWKTWAKGTIDDLAKLPGGFAKDTQLAESINTIFEEIEKKPRLPTVEIATPAEENAKMLGTEVKEDLEMWMMDRGDNLKWVMEDMPEGKFEVPELTLPDTLQDMVGDLIEDAQEFDEAADDATGTSGGNLPQAGWAIMDGPISSFSATGKTGNQLPNDSEITGRSGAGRRGKSAGQMVGSDSAAMEGRPTPARVTNEKYDEGWVNASSQLDPRGSTGGGKKTGGGQQGLQGGTPPDMVKDMQRLEKNQTMLREKAQQLADALTIQGRSSSQVNRAMQLFEDAKGDMRDKRYQDAARKRKMAVGELRNLQSGAQQAVSLSLDKAHAISPELRKEISAGASQPMPQGYEDMVGAYYRALSAVGENAEDRDTPSAESSK